MSSAVVIEPRPTQTQIKHIILEQYLERWGGIIINGLRGLAAQAQSKGRQFELEFVYVDCNASAGRYNGDQADVEAGNTPTTVFGSPIIGVTAMDKLAGFAAKAGIKLRTISILIERDPDKLTELKTSLDMSGFGQRIRETDNFASLQDKEIAVVCADNLALMPKVLAYTQARGKFRFSLFLLDPYGPKGIPMSAVRNIVCSDRHDVIINVPFYDWLKKTGILNKPFDTISETELKLLNNYDVMLDGNGWHRQVKALGSRSSNAIEGILAECYQQALIALDPNLAVKRIPVQFSNRDRTMFYLYLTTHDANGALAMNEILWDARIREHDLRWSLRQAGKLRGGQTTWLDPLPAPPLQIERPSIEEIATKIATTLKGKKLTRGQLYQALADDVYFASEVSKALTQLKKSKQAIYDSPLDNKSVIEISS